MQKNDDEVKKDDVKRGDSPSLKRVSDALRRKGQRFNQKGSEVVK